MTDTFATRAQLVARLSPSYTAPDDPDATAMLKKASELIDDKTFGAAQEAYDGSSVSLKDLLADAACDQVEYWLEVGEEHDVTGLTGMLMSGRLQVSRMPPELGPRAKRTLLRAGLLWAGASAF